MEKLENKKKKHDHKLTNILKATIFSIVMLAPFFSVFVRCMYVMCNKNAKDSYYGETINNVKYIDYNFDINPNETVFLNTNFYTNDNTFNVYVNNFKIINEGNISSSVKETLTEHKNNIRIYGTASYIEFYYYNGSSYTWITKAQGDTSKFLSSFNIVSIDGNYNNATGFYLAEYNKYSYLDNAFEYSISNLENNNLYNWSKELGIYTPINNMVEGLGGNSTISMLLAYWSIYTAIYIVFDIVIWCFVKITHMINED